jgi:hypothetical protein
MTAPVFRKDVSLLGVAGVARLSRKRWTTTSRPVSKHHRDPIGVFDSVGLPIIT